MVENQTEQVSMEMEDSEMDTIAMKGKILLL